MLLKFILISVIIITSYGATVFLNPSLASNIDSTIGLHWFSEKLRWGKENFDNAITDIPSLNEVRTWALDAKEKFLEGVDTTKETIDSVRGWVQKAENTYNEARETMDQAKETFDQAKETFDSVTGKVWEIQWVVDDIQKIWSWSWSLERE